VEQQPEVIMRGFGGQDITNGARRRNAARRRGPERGRKWADYGMVKEKIRVELKRYIQKTTGRRPMVMPVVMEI